MAATKVDIRPPSICKDQLSGSLCETSSSMSGLNAISSPKLCLKRFGGGFSGVPSPCSQKWSDHHLLYKAAANPPTEACVGDLGYDRATGASCLTPLGSCDEEPLLGRSSKGMNGAVSSNFNHGVVFGLLGAFISPLKAPSALGKIGLVNSHHQFSSSLLFPATVGHPDKISTEESLLVPTLPHFEVKCSLQSSDSLKKRNGFVSETKEKEQLCQHVLSVSLSENKELSVLPSVISPSSSKEISEEASEGRAIDPHFVVKVTCDDGIRASHASILDPLSEIHDCNESRFSETRDPEESNDHHNSPSSRTSDQSSCQDLPTIPDSQAPKSSPPHTVNHLVIGDNRELRKLLSDESGFYDTSSPCEPPLNLNGWWQQDCLGPCRDDEDEVDWDDEDSEGGLLLEGGLVVAT